jgi:DNA-binding MarR family transcriptional regulator
MKSLFGDLQSEIKSLNASMKDIIRLEGKLARINDLVDRIGVEQDDVEQRVRVLEKNTNINSVRISGSERIAWLALTSLLAIAVAYMKTQGA